MFIFKKIIDGIHAFNIVIANNPTMNEIEKISKLRSSLKKEVVMVHQMLKLLYLNLQPLGHHSLEYVILTLEDLLNLTM